MDCINYSMRQNGEHRWYYDEETMRLLLESVGFVEIQRREFDPRLDQELRRVGSLYMQCRKPGAGEGAGFNPSALAVADDLGP